MSYTVRTSHNPKPIPSPNYDWDAWLDGNEELGTGWGKTEQDAIADLRNWLTVKDIEI